MFWVAAAAQCAGEICLTENRIVVSLLRTNAFREFCQRLHIAPDEVINAIEDPQALSFEECERRVRRDLAVNGHEFASQEHQASIQLRPLDPSVKGVFHAILEQQGQLGVSPLELLLDLIRTHPSLAQSLALHGLTADSISAALMEQ